MSWPNRKIGPRSLNSRVTSSRRLQAILDRMLARNTRECVAACGEHGIGNGEVGTYQRPVWTGSTDTPAPAGADFDFFEKNAWFPDWEPKTAEQVTPRSEGEPPLDYGPSSSPMGRHRLIKLGDAGDIIKQVTRDYIVTLNAKLIALNTYRACALKRQALKICGRNAARAMAQLAFAVYQQSRRRKGMQNVSTSNRKWCNPAMKGQRGLYSGMNAFRRPVGRPALSEAEWKARYAARLAARRKTSRRRKATGVTLPRTRLPRPAVWPAHHNVVSHPVAGVIRAMHQGTFSRFDWDELLHEGVRDMAKDMARDLGREFGKWLAETANGWLERLFAKDHFDTEC